MKKILALIVILFSIQSHSQTYIKINVLTALVAIPDIAVETGIGKKLTLNVDLMASFWKSFDGKNPMQFVTFTPEVRYHFKGKFNGLYVGGHFGGDVYYIQKWNYWGSNECEKGIGYRLGVTVGYHKKLNDKFMLDIFVSGGNHQGFYHGVYNDGTPGRYETATNFNKSGEWLPYNGGVMISYKLN